MKFLDLLFFDLLKLNKFTTILLGILPLLIILLLSVFNTFRADFPNNLIIFSIEISKVAILSKL